MFNLLTKYVVLGPEAVKMEVFQQITKSYYCMPYYLIKTDSKLKKHIVTV